MFDANLQLLSFPSSVNAGDTFSATFNLTNTGNETFPALGSTPVRVGSSNPYNNTTWGISRLYLPVDIPPGSSVTLTGTFTAPSVDASYIFAWQTVHEFVAWIGNTVSASITVGGISPTPPPSQFPEIGTLPPDPGDGSLVSFIAVRTGPYVPNTTPTTTSWVNTSGSPLEIHKAYLWSGVDQGSIGDVHVQATKHSDGSYIAMLQWDHYAEPTAPNNEMQFDYHPPFMTLSPDDAVDLLYFNHLTQALSHADHLIILWVRYVK